MYWIAFSLSRHPKNELYHLQTPKTGGVVYAAYDLGKEIGTHLCRFYFTW